MRFGVACALLNGVEVKSLQLLLSRDVGYRPWSATIGLARPTGIFGRGKFTDVRYFRSKLSDPPELSRRATVSALRTHTTTKWTDLQLHPRPILILELEVPISTTLTDLLAHTDEAMEVARVDSVGPKRPGTVDWMTTNVVPSKKLV